jgi:cysteinyl-tRNA synthetase
MTLRLYDTLSRTLTDFKPIVEGRVGLYVCGPTVYDHAHIGHARASIAFDILVRRLIAKGFVVNYVRNFTDVDDKIILRARDKGLDWKEMAESYIQSFNEDMTALNCLLPTHSPRATEYVGAMLEDIEAIVKNGYAYPLDGDVYFNVSALPSYGKLSRREADDMEFGARVEVDDRKKNPADFALWKASNPEEPFWESPWGKGRPGWHIECSAMCARLLGDKFDVHGGGQDLVFPHHENEIAQSAALGRSMANLWLHNGFVNINNEKMSKSLGNSFNVKDIFKISPPEVLRFFLLSVHYRGPVDFSEEALAESSKALERVYRTIDAAFSYLGISGDSPQLSENNNDAQGNNQEALTQLSLFGEAMDDDLNASKALGHLFDTVRLTNKRVTEGNRASALSLVKSLLSMGDMLGLKLREPKSFFASLEALKIQKSGKDFQREQIDQKVAQRNEARARKDFALADSLRKELTEMGVALEDRGGETTWRFL